MQKTRLCAVVVLAFILMGRTRVPACVKGGDVCGPGSPNPPAMGLVNSGGHTISQPHVLQVLYGTGTFLPEVTRQAAPSLASFYKQLFASGTIDWLQNEYGVGRGRFAGTYSLTPYWYAGPVITDSEIQVELEFHIVGNTLPAPDGHTVYMLNFPAGKAIVDPDGKTAGFCGYHAAFAMNPSTTIYYAVLPDISANPTACGQQPAAFDDQTSVASHELAEIMTDADYGANGKAFGWHDQNRSEGEIADLCVEQYQRGVIKTHQVAFTGRDEHRYYRHSLWSQKVGAIDPATGCNVTYPRSPEDVLWHNTSRFTAVYYDGDIVKPTGAPGQTPLAAAIVGIGDFDGDGYDDILFRTDLYVTGTTTLTYWWKGQATNPPPSSFKYTTLSGWDIAGLGDFDGDGVTDILWRQRGADPGVVGIWYMGTGAGVNTGTIPAAAKPTIGDFDGDGKADIKWRTVTGTSDTMIVWSAGAAPPNGQIPFAGPGADFAVAATGDFDGDGQSDLYFRSTTTGHSIIWYSGLPWRTADMGVVDLGWQIGAAGNFTRNRWTTDLYVHTGTNQMYILPNGNPALARFVGLVTDPTWSVVGAGNFDF